VFKITKVQKTNPVTYLLEDSREKPVEDSMNTSCMNRAANPEVYLVKKVKERMKFM